MPTSLTAKPWHVKMPRAKSFTMKPNPEALERFAPFLGGGGRSHGLQNVTDLKGKEKSDALDKLSMTRMPVTEG